MFPGLPSLGLTIDLINIMAYRMEGISYLDFSFHSSPTMLESILSNFNALDTFETIEQRLELGF